MRKLLAVLAFSMALPLASGALAQEFPKWPLEAACNAGDDSCRPFEAEARGEISGLWPTLPPDARSQCVSEVGDDKSYRQLYDCLVHEMRQRTRLTWQRPGDRDEGPVEPVNLTPPAKTPENGADEATAEASGTTAPETASSGETAQSEPSESDED